MKSRKRQSSVTFILFVMHMFNTQHHRMIGYSSYVHAELLNIFSDVCAYNSEVTLQETPRVPYKCCFSVIFPGQDLTVLC